MNIHYTKQAVKNIKVLDKATKQRIKMGIEKIPSGDIKKLKGFLNSYRLRVGDYRILYNIVNDTIVIDAVLPRGEAYKNL